MIYGIWKDGAIERRLQADNAFSLGETNYPARWLICATSQERTDLSVYPIQFSEGEPDQRYYTWIEGEPSFADGAINIPVIVSLKDRDSLRSSKLNEVSAKLPGVQSQGVLTEGYKFPTDHQAYIDVWQVARDIADGLLETAQIVDTKGDVIVMTAEQCTILRQSMIALREDSRKNAAALSAEIQAAWETGSPAAILSVDTNAGWPAPPVLPEEAKVPV